MKEKALILNASHNDYRLILALKELGYYVITIGRNPGLMGEKFADEYIQQDYSDKEAVLELAKGLGINAICACCNDFGVLTAAYVAEKLGLPGHDSYEVAQTIHHKDKFKEFAKIHGIKTPIAEQFGCVEEAYDWILENGKFPLMVKAADLSAGNGITKVCGLDDVLPALRLAYEKSRTKRIVIEPFIEGSQHSICAFLIDGKVAASTSCNEYSFVNPYRVEVDTFPAHYIDDVRDGLVFEIEKMAHILKLEDGIFELQYHLTKDHDFWIMEGMRRVLGNLYSIPSSARSGFNWDYWEARAHCGLDCSGFPFNSVESGFHAYRALVAERNGVYGGYKVTDVVSQYITEECILQEPGYQIENHLSDPMGFLFMSFPDQETMDRVMVEKYDEVKVLVR